MTRYLTINPQKAQFLSLTLVALSLFIPAQAEQTRTQCETQKTHIQHILPELLESHNTPSAAVAFISKGELCFSLAAGMQDSSSEVTINTLYNIASLTKPLSAQAILNLVEKGELSAQDKVAEYWVDPDIADHQWLNMLTLHHLISHQSGLPNWRYQTEDRLTFKFQPGVAPSYSGEGYQYMALYAQARLQQPFVDLVRNEVFRPVGMPDTYFSPDDALRPRLAQPFGPQGKFAAPNVQSEFNAADDVYTTINDYSKFLNSVIVNNATAPAQLHSRWQLDHNMASRLCGSGRLAPEDCPEELGFVSGWTKIRYQNATFFMQGGGDWGEKALAVFNLQSQSGVVILTNGANGMKVIQPIIDALMGHSQFSAFITMQAGS